MNAPPTRTTTRRLRTVLWQVASLLLLTGIGVGLARADDTSKGDDAPEKKFDKPLIKIPRSDLPTKADMESMAENPPLAAKNAKSDKAAKNAKNAKAAKEAKEAKEANDERPEKSERRSKVDMNTKADITATTSSNPKEVGAQLREALGGGIAPHKKLTLVVDGKGAANYVEPVRGRSAAQYRQARAAALGLYTPIQLGARPVAPVTWSYEGDNGPANWGKLKPDFSVCGTGQRQSPINIQDGNTLQGPAEPIVFHYTPSMASVVDDGHTIEVDVEGDNTLTIRGSTYRLTEINFHAPAETEINFKRAPMSVQLIHRNDDGQLAVLAVQLEIGDASPLVDKVWTYLPLDTADRVRMPNGLFNVTEILPTDQRYFQFIGSLTSPPCSEGVLWIVFKQPLSVSAAQHKLFTQLFPMNTRPTQPLNGRPIREAQ